MDLFTGDRAPLTFWQCWPNGMRCWIREARSIDAIYLHFAKAFDTVPHQRIIAKLGGYGVKGKVLQWTQLLQHFLVGRRQRMGVAGMYSAWSEVWSGVPQGRC